ncbi:hypothetical protein BJF78_14465 [Pseudonocardia sp. CNS-139]|nr:hypothetical protein BJF78_14465 [Pseudonocardia sp. CNS-139]
MSGGPPMTHVRPPRPRLAAAIHRAAAAADVLAKVLTVVAGTAIIAIMLHTVANALLRHFARSPLPGTDEYVTYWYMPVMALPAFYLAQRRHDHIEAPILFHRLPARIRLELQVAANLVTALLCAGFTYYGWGEAVDAVERGLTGGLGTVPLGPVLLLVPLSFGLFVLQLVADSVVLLRTGRDPAGEPAMPGGAGNDGGRPEGASRS